MTTYMPRSTALALAAGTAVVMLTETQGGDCHGVDRTYPAGTVAVVSRFPSMNPAVTVIIGPPSAAIVNTFDDDDYGGGYPFRLDPLADLIAAARAHSDRLDDPHNDGSGENAVAPTGDDFNALLALVDRAAVALATPTLPCERHLVLSTSHVSEATWGFLQYHRSCCYPKGEYGWFVHVGPDGDMAAEDDPTDLAHVLAFARAQGFDWLTFDRDADVLDELPTYHLTGDDN